MNILETLKGLFGGKSTTTNEVINNATSVVTDHVSDMAEKAVENVINFDDINVSTIMSVAEKFGIMDKLPEAVKSKLSDGTLSDEDLKSFIPEIKGMIMSKMNGNNVVADASHTCGDDCAH